MNLTGINPGSFWESRKDELIMKTIIAVALILVLAGSGFLAYKMMSWEVYASENYRDGDQDYKPVEIRQLIANSALYMDKKVMVQGSISSECPTGCWFYVKDTWGNQLKVELSYGKFAIPQRVGKNVKVEGRLALEDDQLYLVGDRVSIK